ncbi:MAG: uracil-DNA glycosylase [Magnetococcales bacterium]|nr:uracil-DNA glycosylase [Magnetococcales bacterium]
MDLGAALLATLRYWRECGIDRFSGESHGWKEAHRPTVPLLPARPPPPRFPPAAPPAPRAEVRTESPAVASVAGSPPPRSVARVESVPVVAASAVASASLSLDRLLTPPVAVEARGELLQGWARQVSQCRQCGLSLTRQGAIYGAGPPDAPVVWIADAPSAADERAGFPFGGETRELFSGMVRAAGWQRAEAYTTYIIKCRPPGDRTPRSDEIRQCQGYWIQELETVRPKAIVALGKVVVETLLGPTDQLARVRGRVHSWRGVPLIVAYHPAYCLRSPLAKRAMWEDLIRLKKVLEGLNPE